MKYDLIQLMMIGIAISIVVNAIAPKKSSRERQVRLYKECMATPEADKETCKEIAGVESDNR